MAYEQERSGEDRRDGWGKRGPCEYHQGLADGLTVVRTTMRNWFVFLSLLLSVAALVLGWAGRSVDRSLSQIADAATDNARQWDAINTNLAEVRTLRERVKTQGEDLAQLKAWSHRERRSSGAGGE